jgi:hypothetical protein
MLWAVHVATSEIFFKKMDVQARLFLMALEDTDPESHSTAHCFACHQGSTPSIAIGSCFCLFRIPLMPPAGSS